MSDQSQQFTYEYSQPEEYHFSLDSILTSKFIATHMQEKNPQQDFRVLDLCAGCGVMGFELAFHQPQICNIDFLEVQEIYRQHFEKNKKIVNRPELNLIWLQMNYDELKSEKYQHKYDLIICNPPYFQMGQGKISPSEFKNRCRFFIDSTFRNLIEAIMNSLKEKGEAFVLLRPLQQHKINYVNELISIIPSDFSYVQVTDIRGTDLVRIARK